MMTWTRADLGLHSIVLLFVSHETTNILTYLPPNCGRYGILIRRYGPVSASYIVIINYKIKVINSSWTHGQFVFLVVKNHLIYFQKMASLSTRIKSELSPKYHANTHITLQKLATWKVMSFMQ